MSSQLAFRLAVVALSVVGLGGCTAGTNGTSNTGDGGSSAGNAGRGGSGPTGNGGTFSVGGSGGRPSCNGVAGCNLPIPEGCGDGINNQGGSEACDDGNTVPGDGCNGACKVEPNWTCPTAGACMRAFSCGDRVINPGEVCDDGNTTNSDGCNATCTVQDPGYACITPGMACTRTSICGNKRVEPGETCDDGNTNASDGCSAACALETGWGCPAPGSPCSRAARCGDGVVNANLGEVCDDGNAAEGDGCSADCKIRGAGCSCIPGMRCTCPEVRCGNGTIEGTEKCDDGNATAGDGCSATCQLERGYVCPLTRAPCVPDCGDGIIIGNEQCDPALAVTNMNLACSTSCRWNRGWVCLGTPPTSCRATRCGDNVREGLEGCDDGNTVPFDGCSSDCQNEPTLHQRRLHQPLRRRRAARRGVRGRQQPVRRRLLGDVPAGVGLHLRAAAARRQHPGPDHPARLPRLARRLRAGRDGAEPAHPEPRRQHARRRGQAGVRRHREPGLHHQRDHASRSGTATSPTSTTRRPPR